MYDLILYVNYSQAEDSYSTLNNTYKFAHIKWARISVNTGQIIFKFSTNIKDIYVIKLHLFYYE